MRSQLGRDSEVDHKLDNHFVGPIEAILKQCRRVRINIELRVYPTTFGLESLLSARENDCRVYDRHRIIDFGILALTLSTASGSLI